MKDYLTQVEKLRKEAAECARVRDSATDQAKRELFDRLTVHLSNVADQVELEMLNKHFSTRLRLVRWSQSGKPHSLSSEGDEFIADEDGLAGFLADEFPLGHRQAFRAM
jgi:hypothetical protein